MPFRISARPPTSIHDSAGKYARYSGATCRNRLGDRRNIPIVDTKTEYRTRREISGVVQAGLKVGVDAAYGACAHPNIAALIDSTGEVASGLATTRWADHKAQSNILIGSARTQYSKYIRCFKMVNARGGDGVLRIHPITGARKTIGPKCLELQNARAIRRAPARAVGSSRKKRRGRADILC